MSWSPFLRHNRGHHPSCREILPNKITPLEDFDWRRFWGISPTKLDQNTDSVLWCSGYHKITRISYLGGPLPTIWKGYTAVSSILGWIRRIDRRTGQRPSRSEKDLERYEWFAVQEHVRDTISELCKIFAAQKSLRLEMVRALTTMLMHWIKLNSLSWSRPSHFWIHPVYRDRIPRVCDGVQDTP